MDTCNERRVYHGKTEYLSTIFSRWRKLHLVSLLIALLSAFTACFTFVVYDNKFNPHCPLYAKISLIRVQDGENDSLNYMIIDKGSKNTITKWGPDTSCNFVLSVLLINMLIAVSWILLFCTKGGFSPNFHQKLVPPTCICGLLATVISFAGAIIITRGGNTFCEGFKSSELEKCATAQYVHWLNFPTIHGFYDYLKRCEISAWVTTHTWFFHFNMSLIRWVTDADYAIAEERELHERSFDHYGATVMPHPVRENNSDSRSKGNVMD